MTNPPRLYRIDLQTLRLFATVVKDGSISRAAERNHIAASALSRRLSDLEDAVGVPLLVRSPKGVSVTDAGRAVLQRAERIQEELRCLLDDATSAMEAQATVRLAASHSVVGGVLPDLLRAFRPGRQQVRVEIIELNSQEVLDACADGTADVGLGLGVRPPLPGTVESWTLWSDRLQVVMREDHLLARHSTLCFEQVLAFPVIGSNPAGALAQQLRLEASALGIPFLAEVSASNFSAACRLAESGLGLAVVPAVAIPARMTAPLVRRPLAEEWALRPLRVYQSRRATLCAGALALVQHLRRQALFVSTLRLDDPGAEKGPRFEPKFAVAASLPVEKLPAAG